jgi:hypothetical protein
LLTVFNEVQSINAEKHMKDPLLENMFTLREAVLARGHGQIRHSRRSIPTTSRRDLNMRHRPPWVIRARPWRSGTGGETK